MSTLLTSGMPARNVSITSQQLLLTFFLFGLHRFLVDIIYNLHETCLELIAWDFQMTSYFILCFSVQGCDILYGFKPMDHYVQLKGLTRLNRTALKIFYMFGWSPIGQEAWCTVSTRWNCSANIFLLLYGLLNITDESIQICLKLWCYRRLRCKFLSYQLIINC